MRTGLELLEVLEHNKFMIVECLVHLLLLLMLALLLPLHLQVASVQRNVGLRNSDLHVCQILRIRPAGFDRRADEELGGLRVHSIRLWPVGEIG